MNLRQTLLWGLLAISIGAAMWITGRDDDSSTFTDAARKPGRLVRVAPHLAGDDNADASVASTEVATLNLDLASLTAHFARAGRAPDESLSRGAGHAFGAKAWYVSPPPPPPAPPEPPTAPPLPFKYLGRYKASDTEEATCFIVKNDQTFAVLAGSMIEEIYRVDSISSDSIEFTYLPLEQKQTLSIGSTP